MSRSNEYTKGNLLDSLFHQNYYKLIGRDLSRQVFQQIDYVRKLEKADGTTMWFVSKKQQKTILNIFLD